MSTVSTLQLRLTFGHPHMFCVECRQGCSENKTGLCRICRHKPCRYCGIMITMREKNQDWHSACRKKAVRP